MKRTLQSIVVGLTILGLTAELTPAQHQDSGRNHVGQQQPAQSKHEYKRLTVKGRTFDYAIVLPKGFDAKQSYPVLLAFPAGDQSQAMVDAGLAQYWESEAISRGWIVVSPVAPNKTMFHRGSEDLIPGLLDAVGRSLKVEGNKFHVAGVSSGGLSAYRVAIGNHRRIASLSTLPGYPPQNDDESDLGRLRGVKVNMWVGAQDAKWRKASETVQGKLTRIGIDSTLTVVEGQGHVLTIPAAELYDALDAARPGARKGAKPAGPEKEVKETESKDSSKSGTPAMPDEDDGEKEKKVDEDR